MDVRRAPSVLALAGLVVLGLVARGCSQDGETRSASGTGGSAGDASSGSGGLGPGGSGGTTAIGGAAGTGGSGGTGGCAPTNSLPKNVPTGWEAWTDYSCACPLFVPGPTADALPAVGWEPCPQPGPSNPTCRRVKTKWTQTSAISLNGLFWFDSSANRAYLQLNRLYNGDDPNIRYKTVEQVDGEVLHAFLELNPINEGCMMLPYDFSDGHFAFGMLGDSWSGPYLGTKEGVVAGAMGTQKPLVIKQDMPGQSTSHWYVSKEWLVEGRIKLVGHSWDLKETHTVYDPATDPEGMKASFARARGDAVFWEVGSAGYRGVMSWTKQDGARPLLRWYGDWTQGAGNFNTDGIDMVWTHGQDKTPDTTQEYPTRSIMTAPFTTDPAVVMATQKRLRSDPWHLTPHAFGVGCGHAGRHMFTDHGGGSLSRDLLIVRLSDGVSWVVGAPPASSNMMFSHVLGFTCEEVFAAAQFPDDTSTIVRIRLDSLGPGVAPD